MSSSRSSSEMAAPEPPEAELSRQTSFARSFFQAGASHDALQFTRSTDDDDDDDDDDLDDDDDDEDDDDGGGGAGDHDDNDNDDDEGARPLSQQPARKLPPPSLVHTPFIDDDDTTMAVTPPPPPPTGRIRRRASLVDFQTRRATSQRLTGSCSSRGSTVEAAAASAAGSGTGTPRSSLRHAADTVRRSLLDDDDDDDHHHHHSIMDDYGDGDLFGNKHNINTMHQHFVARKNSPQMKVEPDIERQPSWFRDALLQQGGMGMDQEKLRKMLGLVEPPPPQEDDEDQVAAVAARHSEAAAPANFDDDQVLEQYRIMAIFQARQLFKEKEGCEVEEYREQRWEGQKRSGNASSSSEQTRHRHHHHVNGRKLAEVGLPPVCVPTSDDEIWNHSAVKQLLAPSSLRKEWNIPMPRLAPLQLFEESFSKPAAVKEIQTGKVVPRGTTPVFQKSSPVASVRCVQCKTHLQVEPEAGLVLCPTCSTVNPNNATRYG